jgi:Flp pilus assembly protein TadD
MPGEEAAMRAACARAGELLNALLKVSPMDAAAWSRLAVVHVRLREWREAHNAADAALRIQPDSLVVLRNAAIVEAFRGNNKEAVALLERAVKAGEDPVDILSDTDLQGLVADPATRARFESTTKR